MLEFDSGNWAEARVLFSQAHALRPSARTLRGMGKASFELKEYVRAQRELNASLTELRSPLSDPQRQEMLALLLRIEKFVGLLKVRVKPESADATIMLDGLRLDGELKLNLGQHDLSVEANGYRTVNRTVSIEGGKTQHLELTLSRLQSESDASLHRKAAAQAEEMESVALSTHAHRDGSAPPTDQASTGVLGQWWFWTLVGAVVAGGASAAIVLTAQRVPDSPALGNTGLAVGVLTLGH